MNKPLDPIYLHKYLRQKRSGFTLAELAIVLLIVGLLLAGLLTPLSTQVDIKRRNDTQKALEEMKEALIGFAIANGRLPCPAPDQLGSDNLGATPTITPNPPGSTKTFTCNSFEGFFPHQALGLGQSDAWGNLFRYRVDASFARRVENCTLPGGGGVCNQTSSFDLSTTPTLVVNTRTDNPATPPPTIEAKFLSPLTSAASRPPVIIISHGKNGLGTLTVSGTPLGTPAVGTDEYIDADTTQSAKISRTPTAAQAGCSDTAEGQPFCEFDDLVSWLPLSILRGRMVSAGRLP